MRYVIERAMSFVARERASRGLTIFLASEASLCCSVALSTLQSYTERGVGGNEIMLKKYVVN